MNRRLELQSKFEELLGSRNVYYNPPATLKMQYDAIRYSLSGLHTAHANNAKYSKMFHHQKKYYQEHAEINARIFWHKTSCSHGSYYDIILT